MIYKSVCGRRKVDAVAGLPSLRVGLASGPLAVLGYDRGA